MNRLSTVLRLIVVLPVSLLGGAFLGEIVPRALMFLDNLFWDTGPYVLRSWVVMGFVGYATGGSCVLLAGWIAPVPYKKQVVWTVIVSVVLFYIVAGYFVWIDGSFLTHNLFDVISYIVFGILGMLTGYTTCSEEWRL